MAKGITYIREEVLTGKGETVKKVDLPNVTAKVEIDQKTGKATISFELKDKSEVKVHTKNKSEISRMESQGLRGLIRWLCESLLVIYFHFFLSENILEKLVCF